MNTLSPEFQALLDTCAKIQAQTGPIPDITSSTISIHSLTSKAATVYEKVRYLVDYKDEHVVRRSAIERILKRILFIENKQEAGKALLHELVSGRYLPNNSVPESEALSVQAIIDVFRPCLSTIKASLRLTHTEQMIFGILASEVEAYLFPQPLNETIFHAFFAYTKKNLTYDGPLSAEAFETQLFIACRKALLKSDEGDIRYHLFCKAFSIVPGTFDAQAFISNRPRYTEAVTEIDELLQNPIGPSVLGRIKNFAIYFYFIREVILAHKENSAVVMSNPAELDASIRTILAEKYEVENAKLRRSGVRAILYILATKMVIALPIEMLYDVVIQKLAYTAINYKPLAINLVFHPSILFLLTRNIKTLGEDNTLRVISGIHEVVYGQPVKMITLRTRESGVMEFVFSALYAILFAFTFGLLLWVLLSLQFNPASITLFVLFIALVSYFGLRIRHNAEKWRVYTGNDKVLSLFWNSLTLPIVRLGMWLTRTFSSINVFVFVMDFLVESSFRIILKVFDSFLTFLKDKKEETY
ncbi:MAG: hypothetical protein RLZZ347_795 [Candidatus Parcubacteria bacterium]|jgi:hypothetical protein